MERGSEPVDVLTPATWGIGSAFSPTAQAAGLLCPLWQVTSIATGFNGKPDSNAMPLAGAATFRVGSLRHAGAWELPRATGATGAYISQHDSRFLNGGSMRAGAFFFFSQARLSACLQPGR